MNAALKIIIAGLVATLTAAAQNAPVLVLSGGQRVKIESKKLDRSAVVADSIELADPDEDLEIEGPISKVNRQTRSFGIGEVLIQITDKTRIETAERQPRLIGDLRDGIRVKVKTRTFEGRLAQADEVRIYENSGDRDFEIVAPIERIDPERSELSLISLNVRITEKTLHPGIEVQDIESTGQYIRRDDDEPARPPLRLGPVFVGGKFRFAYEESNDLDLNSEEDDLRRSLTPSAELEVSAPLGEHSQIYGRFNGNRAVDLREPGQSTNQFKVYELFLYMGNFLHRSMALQIGRQRIRDNREWLFDERLDSIRLHIGKSKLKTEFAFARALWPTTSSRDQLYLIGRTEYRFVGQNYIGGHFIKRNDTTVSNEDPTWFGLNARGRVVRDIRYWLEYGLVRGHKSQTKLRGYGYDAGFSYRFRKIPLEPTLTGSYAFGSGDNDTTDGIDGNFRQTGLQDNSHRIGGLKRHRFYGDLTRPELLNMKIATLDLGFRQNESWSLNFVYHTYRQVIPVRRTGDIELDLRPRGRNPNLGRELDAVFALRKKRSFDFYLVSGVFVPGPAYEGPRNRAFLLKPEFYFYF